MAVEDRLLQVLVRPPSFDIDGLAGSALESFAIIEKCKSEQPSDHHLVTIMIERIMTQADEYVRAIDMSLAAARKGCEFADDAMDLCKLVAKGDSHIEDLMRFLSDMMDKAGAAHAQALAMDKKFKGVRSSLFQIARNVPSDVKKIEREQLNTGVVATNNGTANQISNNMVLETATKSFHDIIAQLERAGNDLADLAGHVGNFVNWWSDIKSRLGSLQSSISLIKLDGSNPLRQEVVLQRWERLREQYLHYQTRISVITDFYPKQEGRPDEGHRRGPQSHELKRVEQDQWREPQRLGPTRQERQWQKDQRRQENGWQEAKGLGPGRRAGERQGAERVEEDRLEQQRQHAATQQDEEWLEAKRRKVRRLEEGVGENRQREENRLEVRWQEGERQETKKQEAKRVEEDLPQEQRRQVAKQEEERLESQKREARRIEERLGQKRQREENRLEASRQEQKQRGANQQEGGWPEAMDEDRLEQRRQAPKHQEGVNWREARRLEEQLAVKRQREGDKLGVKRQEEKGRIERLQEEMRGEGRRPKEKTKRQEVGHFEEEQLQEKRQQEEREKWREADRLGEERPERERRHGAQRLEALPQEEGRRPETTGLTQNGKTGETQKNEAEGCRCLIM